MPADPPLRPATRDELLTAISYALRFDRRGKATRRNDALTAQLAAESLVDLFERSGFVVMKKPPAPSAIEAEGVRAAAKSQ